MYEVVKFRVKNKMINQNNNNYKVNIAAVETFMKIFDFRRVRMVYVTTMQRYNNREGHWYIVGVFESLEKAIEAGTNEAEWRGWKYSPIVHECELNKDYGCAMKPLPEVVYMED